MTSGLRMSLVGPGPRAENVATRFPVSDSVSNKALQAALEVGRLCDFFLMVRQVLRTYNPDSPYVSLDNWEGKQCSDCGDFINEDCRCYCELCDRTYCEQCMSVCRSHASTW